MRIAFFGTPAFAAAILEALPGVVVVVTQPDKPQGRSSQPQASAVKEVALKRGLPLLQPAKASDPAFIEELKSYSPDLLVVVAYGQIFRQVLLDVAPAINVHASLLPHLRGAAPLQWALIRGDQESGITIMKMSLGMDEGDILLQKACPIDPSWNAAELAAALLPLAQAALLEVVQSPHSPIARAQDPSQATYAPKLTSEDACISFEAPAEAVHNRIRGCNPAPGSWTTVFIKGEPKKLKILKSLVIKSLKSETPGTILAFNSREGLIVACQKGALQLEKIQLEGKKPSDSKSFALGSYKDDLYFLGKKS